MKKPRVIFWFRTDLRLTDNVALQAALDLNPAVLWPIFTFDPFYAFQKRGGSNRWQFLLDCQHDLSASISRLNPKNQLHVIRESPKTLFPKIFKAWRVTHLVFEKDTDAYARERDEVVMKAAADAGVEVVIRGGRTLWDSDEIVAKNGGKPTMSISQLQAAGDKIGPIPRPIPAPKSLPDPGETPIDFEHDQPETEPDLNAECRVDKDTTFESIAGPKGDFGVVTLEELGFPSATASQRGGETLALKKMDTLIKDAKYMATFEKPKTSPAQFEPQSTTLLSPFFHFGALSVRTLYWAAQDAVDAFKGKGASSPPVSLTGQVLFRDMYFAAQAALGPVYTQTYKNPYFRFIPWHLPSKIDPATGLTTGEYHVDSEEANVWFRRWKEGVTGFPWIDALMRQLKYEGWIHHLGRHSVACFLTRGGCYIDWERGDAVFAEWLLDYEPACNSGNWCWLSCTAFFSQYYRCYSPIAFGQKWDKNGDLIRKFVPELKDFPAKYIYEPWKAPIVEQRKAGVKIQGNGLEKEDGVYPKPMFDFNERRGVCIAAMKTAYNVGLHGNDEAVLNGTWRDLFPKDDDAEIQQRYQTDDGEHADEGENLEQHAGAGVAGDKRAAEVKSPQAAPKKQKKISDYAAPTRR
ncbi:hypothetical protein S40293_07733 [Stachybotrys chartarum IBT 40293]|nr:hypothetical protein S40293_07733 [Stachybotrys chartarum IBT 40293]